MQELKKNVLIEKCALNTASIHVFGTRSKNIKIII